MEQRAAEAIPDERLWQLAAQTYQRLAPQFAGKGTLDTEDVFSAALVGAVEARRRFDPARGVRFASYAINLIRFAIKEELRQQDHLKRHHREAIEQRGDTFPAWAMPPVSYEEAVGTLLDADGADAVTLGDTLTDRDTDTQTEALWRLEVAALRKALGWLTVREQDIVCAYYWQETAARTLAHQFGVTEWRIYQILADCRARLREWLDGWEDTTASSLARQPLRHGERVCEYCGGSFVCRPGERPCDFRVRRFCSAPCRHAFRRKKR